MEPPRGALSRRARDPRPFWYNAGGMKVRIWATTLQADIIALALHLDGRADCEPLVVAEGLDAFQREPIARARPLRAPCLERDATGTRDAVRAFAADVVVADNHLPEFRAAPNVCTLWHGLGWKARGRADIAAFHKRVRELTGQDGSTANPRLLAQCYGAPDRDWRVDSWGLHPDNCEVLGMAFTDLLLDPPFAREDLAAHYRIDVVAKPTVLLNFTWHYGRIFPGAWTPPGLLSRSSAFEQDLALLEQVIDTVLERGANVLFCLHDRKRYEPAYLAALHAIAERRTDVQLKHKCEHPDNLADLMVADVMVSNLSSFITYFYASGRPSVHLCPAQDGASEIKLARLKRGKLRARSVDAGGDLWMNAPTDNGGLTARSAEQALEAIATALDQPDCCVERSRSVSSILTRYCPPKRRA